MKVEESESFDEYWKDERFTNKKPVFNKGAKFMYGDNIYHKENGKWRQERSHHSNEDGSVNYANLKRDTGTNRVLIATDFYYFGNNAIEIPKEFNPIIHKGRNHGVITDQMIINGFIRYLKTNYNEKIYGVPYSRVTGKFANYGG